MGHFLSAGRRHAATILKRAPSARHRTGGSLSLNDTPTRGTHHALSPLRQDRSLRLRALPRHDDLRRQGLLGGHRQARRQGGRVDRRHRARRGRQLHRHRRRLLRGGVRDARGRRARVARSARASSSSSPPRSAAASAPARTRWASRARTSSRRSTRACGASKLDHVDLYQIHGVDKDTPIEETVRALDDVVRSGKARYVGFSNLPAWLAMKAIALRRRQRPRAVPERAGLLLDRRARHRARDRAARRRSGARDPAVEPARRRAAVRQVRPRQAGPRRGAAHDVRLPAGRSRAAAQACSPRCARSPRRPTSPSRASRSPGSSRARSSRASSSARRRESSSTDNLAAVRREAVAGARRRARRRERAAGRVSGLDGRLAEPRTRGYQRRSSASRAFTECKLSNHDQIEPRSLRAPKARSSTPFASSAIRTGSSRSSTAATATRARSGRRTGRS